MRMRPAAARTRAGLTLTEVLIGIMILAIGLVSIATLFPIGLLRFRSAMRDSRSRLLAESAESEIQARDLLNNASFLQSWYSTLLIPVNPRSGDPWLYDLASGFSRDPDLNYDGTYDNDLNGDGIPDPPGPGLPVAYDPLWWSVVYQNSGGTVLPSAPPPLSRFGFGASIFANYPGTFSQTGTLSTPSAFGLQRITNFAPIGMFTNFPFVFPASATAADAFDMASDVFVSRDDIVMQTDGEPDGTYSVGNPTIPDLSTTDSSGNRYPLNDWSYSWFWTGQRTNALDYSVYDGTFVICNNRAFGFDAIDGPTDERTVEAWWGALNDRSAVLRWPVSDPDPNIAVGNWIADVTYQQVTADVTNWLASGDPYPPQRCYWYQVTRRSDPEPDPYNSSLRRMVVTLNDRVRARTVVDSTGTPYHLNTALICPTVVHAFNKVVYSHGSH